MMQDQPTIPPVDEAGKVISKEFLRRTEELLAGVAVQLEVEFQSPRRKNCFIMARLCHAMWKGDL